MAKREFVMLAHVYRGDEPVGSWFMSEKLDGCRAFWDGGVTRGLTCRQVPFANVEKDARYVTEPRATGLWSRYGKAIQAPGWWLDLLPVGIPLDGELYMTRGSFQSLMSTVKKIQPDPQWRKVEYRVFDVPPYHAVFANGEINNTNFRKKLVGIHYEQGRKPERWDFESVQRFLGRSGIENGVVVVQPQMRLPAASAAAREAISAELDRVVSGKGEGVMLRNPSSMWVPQRARTLLKAKGVLDSEAEVVGYVFGRETDKGSKLLGLMGAMIVRWNGRIFELSGFSDEERWLVERGHSNDMSAYEFASLHPGERAPDSIHSAQFPVGSRVSFTYRELSEAGIPKEARFRRSHDEV